MESSRVGTPDLGDTEEVGNLRQVGHRKTKGRRPDDQLVRVGPDWHDVTTESARQFEERRYLDRTPTLFPDLDGDWNALLEQAERLASLGDVVTVAPSRVDGAHRRRGPSLRRPAIDLRQLRTAAHDRALEEAASLVEAARATALDALGDMDGVATIAERRLHWKAEPRQCL